MADPSQPPFAPIAPDAPHRGGHYRSEQMQPDNSVGYLMRKVMSSIRTQADAQLALHDLTYVQWLPLFKLSLCSTRSAVASREPWGVWCAPPRRLATRRVTP